jgi:hypothetical protein
MIFEAAMEGFFLSIEGESYHLAPAFGGGKRAYITKTYRREGGKVENGFIPKEQFDREVGHRFTPVTDETMLAKLMLLGME